MGKWFTCSGGHRWQTTDADLPGAALQAICCPECGEAANSLLPADESGPPNQPPGERGTANVFSQETPVSAPSIQPQPTRVDQNLWAFLAPAQAPDELGRLGTYRILKVLGAGGMGVVFQAEDVQLQRMVAVKAMLPSLAADESAKQRFLREARAIAKLKHPRVVTIHQVGEDRGVPYLVMEFLDGESLNDRLHRASKLRVPDVLRIGREIAEGLAAAHERGLIHRDIKPANIWLEGTKGRVKILDFGLVRAASGEAELTQSGAILGTPGYLSPEQARGKKVDRRCDLFSLGCVLYRMATGNDPFRGDDIISTLLAVSTEEPTPPATLNRELPAELSDFILQLLAKRPEERPASAQVVAATLERMAQTTGSPKRIPTSPEPAGHKRMRAVVVMILALVLLGGGLLALQVILRLRTAEGDLLIETDDADGEPVIKTNKSKEKAVKQPPLAARRSAWKPGPEHDILPGLVPRPSSFPNIRRWQVETIYPRSLVTALAWRPDGSLLACGGFDGAIRVFDAGGRLVRIFLGGPKDINSLVWSRDGSRLAGVAWDGVRVWDFNRSRLIWHVRLSARYVAWSADDKRIACGVWTRRRGVCILDAAKGESLRELTGHANSAGWVDWSSDGRWLATWGEDRKVRLWNATDYTPGPVLPSDPKPAYAAPSLLTWSPDGRLLAYFSKNTELQLWDGVKMRAEASIKLPDLPYLPFQNLCWHPDSRQLTVGYLCHGMQMIQRDSEGRWRAGEMFNMDSNEGYVPPYCCSRAWSRDGRWLASGSEECIQLFDPVRKGWGGQFGYRQGVFALDWSPDSQRFAVSCFDRCVRVWRAEQGHQEYAVRGLRRNTWVAWHPKGQSLATLEYGREDGLCTWDSATGSLLRRYRTPDPRGLTLAWHPNGRWLTLVPWLRDGRIRFWDTRSESEIEGPPESLDYPQPGAVAWSADGKRLATGGLHTYIWSFGRDRFWDTPVVIKKTVYSLAFHPDGKGLVGGGGPDLVGRLLVWDSTTGAVKEQPRFPILGDWEDLTSIHWSPDGKRLVAVASSGRILCIDYPGWKVKSLHTEDRASFYRVAWSPDGRKIVAGGTHHLLRMWDAAGERLLWTAVLLSGPQPALFSEAGELLESPPETEDELVYIVEKEKNVQQMLTPSEFRKQIIEQAKK